MEYQGSQIRCPTCDKSISLFVREPFLPNEPSAKKAPEDTIECYCPECAKTSQIPIAEYGTKVPCVHCSNMIYVLPILGTTRLDGFEIREGWIGNLRWILVLPTVFAVHLMCSVTFYVLIPHVLSPKLSTFLGWALSPILSMYAGILMAPKRRFMLSSWMTVTFVFMKIGKAIASLFMTFEDEQTWQILASGVIGWVVVCAVLGRQYYRGKLPPWEL